MATLVQTPLPTPLKLTVPVGAGDSVGLRVKVKVTEASRLEPPGAEDVTVAVVVTGVTVCAKPVPDVADEAVE